MARGIVSKEVKVSGGSHLKKIKKIKMIKMPNQNDGIAKPPMEKMRTR